MCDVSLVIESVGQYEIMMLRQCGYHLSKRGQHVIMMPVKPVRIAVTKGLADQHRGQHKEARTTQRNWGQHRDTDIALTKGGNEGFERLNRHEVEILRLCDFLAETNP